MLRNLFLLWLFSLISLRTPTTLADFDDWRDYARSMALEPLARILEN